jgi:hypothetical protein
MCSEREREMVRERKSESASGRDEGRGGEGTDSICARMHVVCT